MGESIVVRFWKTVLFSKSAKAGKRWVAKAPQESFFSKFDGSWIVVRTCDRTPRAKNINSDTYAVAPGSHLCQTASTKVGLK